MVILERKKKIKKDDVSNTLDDRYRAFKEKLQKKGILKDSSQNSDENSAFKTAGETQTAIGQAIKYASEFFAAVLVGALIGIGFDHLTGLTPWGLIFFLFLGFCAAVRNILRSVEPASDMRNSDSRKESRSSEE